MSQLRIRKGLQLWVSPAFDRPPVYVDMSGFARDLESTGAPGYGAGPLGNIAWTFNGSSQFLERPVDKIKVIMGPRSYTAIISIRIDGATEDAADLQDNHGVLSSNTANPNGGGVYVRNVAGEHQIYIRRGKKLAYQVVTVGQWYTVIAHRLAGQVRIGFDPASMAIKKAGGADNYGSATARLFIGRNHATEFFNGAIAEVLIYRPALKDQEVPLAWAAAADKILNSRGDPEEQMRDLVSRRALISEKLTYGVRTRRDFWDLAVGDDIALTHRNILLRDGEPSSVVLSRRYEARVVGREMDIDVQTTVLGTEERQRIIVYSSLRADHVTANHDGLLLTGARLQQSSVVSALLFDPNGNAVVMLEAGVKKINVNGWQVEQGGLPTNSIFADPQRSFWTLAGGTKRQKLLPAIPPLFVTTLKAGKVKRIRTLFIPAGGTATATTEGSYFNGHAWLRFVYRGEGTIELTSTGGRTWDWEGGSSGEGEWVTASPITLALPEADVWTEFLYGPIPPDAGAESATWKSSALVDLRLGYASFSKAVAYVGTDNNPTPADIIGQGDTNDAGHIYFPLSSSYSDEGAIRFKFAPRWDGRRWDQITFEAEESSRICIMRINGPGSVQPDYTIAYDPATDRLELWQNDGSDLVCFVQLASNFFLPDVKHTILVVWSVGGVDPYLAAEQIKLYIDNIEPTAAGDYTAPFAPAGGPFFLAAGTHPEFAEIMPNGSYSDIIITSRIVDVFADKMLEVEAS